MWTWHQWAQSRSCSLTHVLFTPTGSPLKCHQTDEDSLIVLSRLVWALHKTVLLVLAKLFNRDKAPCHFSLTPPNSFKCHRSAVSWCRLRQQFLNPVTLFGFLKRSPWLCFCIFHPPLDGTRRVGFRSPTRFSVCRCLFPGGNLWCTAAQQRLRSKVAFRAAFTPPTLSNLEVICHIRVVMYFFPFISCSIAPFSPSLLAFSPQRWLLTGEWFWNKCGHPSALPRGITSSLLSQGLSAADGWRQ